MHSKISVVINTFNEEKNISNAIKSVQWADEIIVCDMYSDDETGVIAKKLGAKILFHKRTGFVEPARNFAISRAEGDWILVLDADEEIPDSLADKLKEVAHQDSVVTFVEIPRQNIIFGKVMKASLWWPDYHIRFFKKDKVTWSSKIHSKPKTEGQGLRLAEIERFAITHNHYESISQYISRMDRYTSVQAKELRDSGYKFEWRDLISKPISEFLSRFFAGRGFEDGIHGLALSFLQSFSHFVMYLKVWELEGFEKKDLKFSDVDDSFKNAGKEISYWLKYGNLSKNKVKRTWQLIKNRLS